MLTTGVSPLHCRHRPAESNGWFVRIHSGSSMQAVCNFSHRSRISKDVSGAIGVSIIAAHHLYWFGNVIIVKNERDGQKGTVYAFVHMQRLLFL